MKWGTPIFGHATWDPHRGRGVWSVRNLAGVVGVEPRVFLLLSTAKRRWNNLKGPKDFNLKAKARIWS